MAAGQQQTSGPSGGTKELEHITPEVRSRLAVKVGSALKAHNGRVTTAVLPVASEWPRRGGGIQVG